MTTKATQTEIQPIDFAEAEWKEVEDDTVRRYTDYGSLEAVKRLVDGKAISVPLNTATHRLYRWLDKHNYRLHKKKVQGNLILWTTTKQPKAADEE